MPLLLAGQKHAFYLSTLEVAPRSGTSYSLCIKTFTDDLEAALQNQAGQPVRLSPETWAAQQGKVSDYFRHVLKLEIQGRAIGLRLDAAEFQPDAIWTTFAFKAPPYFREVHITCTLFTELFENQINALSFRKGDETRWLKMDKETVEGDIIF